MNRALTTFLWASVVACGGTGTTDATDGDTATGDSIDTGEALPEPEAPPGYSGDSCPAFSAGTVEIESNNLTREVVVSLPAKPEGKGVLFLWHGNGDSASNFSAAMGAPGLATEYKWIVVAMEAGSGGLGLDWSVPPNQVKPDVTFFEDVLSCLDEQYGIDRREVYTAGFSAGALWSSWLLTHRAEHLAAGVTFSGGTDGSAGPVKVNPYSTPSWPVPVLMTHGGPGDNVVVSFKSTTESMSTKLRRDGSTAIVCPHANGHTVPSGYQRWAWPFLKAHRYGMDPSPYADGTDPSGELPDNCAWE